MYAYINIHLKYTSIQHTQTQDHDFVLSYQSKIIDAQVSKKIVLI